MQNHHKHLLDLRKGFGPGRLRLIGDGGRVEDPLMKLLHLFGLAMVLTGLPASARENQYALFGRALAPFINIFAQQSKDPNRSMQLAVRLEALTGLPEALAGAKADLSMQAPDKLRIHWPVQGEDLTICRNGQDLWVHPGSKAAALLQQLDQQKKLPPPDAKYRLAPFRLPIPDKDLVFLPALLELQDAGDEQVNGVACRVIDGRISPVLAKTPSLAGWSFRLWVRPDARPARLQVQRKSAWSVTVSFDTVAFQPALPAETWQPAPEEAGDVAKLPPGRYNQYLRLIFGAE